MERSGFFDSEVTGHNSDGSPIYDREYLSEFFALYFSSFIGNGIFPNPATNLQLLTNNDMTVIIKQGKAWINGIFYINTDNLIFKIDVADGVLNRIDRLVLRLDFLERKIKTVVKKGIYAGTAVAQSLQRDADAYEIALADIAVNKGIISISQANITDLRLNKDLCGIVHGTVDQVDPTAIFNQYQVWFTTQSNTYNADMVAKETDFTNQFNVWFTGIQNTLGSDIAGNLLNQINGLAGTGRTTETVKKNADAIAAINTNVANLSTSVATSLAEMATKVDLDKKQDKLTISSATNSTSTTQVANSASVKTTYDLATTANNNANGREPALPVERKRKTVYSTADPSGTDWDVWIKYKP